jgi:hypothetical protein
MSKTFLAVIVAVFSTFALSTSSAEKYVKLVHFDTGKVLSIEGNSDDNEAKAVIAKDDDSKSQQWQLVKDGEFYKIVNRKSGRVLDVNNESTDEGGEIIQWDDKSDGNDNQRWSWEGGGAEKDKKDEPRRLKSKSSKLVLDVTSEDKVVQQKVDEKGKGQLWKVVEVSE